MPAETFHDALFAFGAGDLAGALASAREAAACDSGSRVFAAAVPYLERVLREGKQGVYVTGDGFGAFIRGGGNVPLYEALSGALAAAHAEHPGASLLEVGVGDGMALLPALGPSLASITLLEPSGPMLAATSAALAARGIAHEPIHGTLQDLVRLAPARRWDLAEATFSLQSIPAVERPRLLAWLHGAAPRLLLAEFDVPPFADDRARARDVVQRYERGLAEYDGDGGLVAQGFLMPVLFGYFDPTRARTNEEQPIAAWVHDLEQAGFGRVERRLLHAYWWADAYLVDARG